MDVSFVYNLFLRPDGTPCNHSLVSERFSQGRRIKYFFVLLGSVNIPTKIDELTVHFLLFERSVILSIVNPGRILSYFVVFIWSE